MRLVYMSMFRAISLEHVGYTSVHEQVGLAQYSAGDIAPNYPVPALRYSVLIDDNGVTIFNRTSKAVANF